MSTPATLDDARDKLAEARYDAMKAILAGDRIRLDLIEQRIIGLDSSARLDHEIVMRKLTAPLQEFACSSDDCGMVFYYALSGFNGEPPRFCPVCGAGEPTATPQKEG